MALTAGTIWQIQATATTGNVNGAGFNPANANMLTNFAATNGNTSSPVITSASYNFTANDVGHYFYVKSGTNWVAGWYPIASVAANAATLDASVGAAVLSIGAKGVVTRNTSVGCATVASPTSGTGTIDYSQKDTAIVNGLTDLTCTAASTTVTSASAPFSPVMVGNILHATALTGTGAIVGWYEIVSYTNTSNVVLDRTPTNGVNNITAGTFYVGGAGRLNGLEDSFKTMVPTGAIIFIKNGTYTFSGAATTSSSNGTAASPVFYIGFNSSRGDTCILANRPTIAMGANAFTSCSNTIHYNLIFTTTASNGIQMGGGSWFINCKGINSSTSAGRNTFFQGANGGGLVACEVICQNGNGYGGNTGSPRLYGNYFHDCDAAINNTSPNSGPTEVIGNIFEGCTTYAIRYSGSATSGTILNNTIYGREAKVGTGVNMPASNSGLVIMNNILYGLATGINIPTSASNINISNYNNFYNNTTDNTNWTKESTDLAVDPQFTNVSQTTGTTATTSGSTLTQSGGNFSDIQDNVDYLHVTSGTGVTTGCYLITGHTTTTLTTNNALGTSSAGDVNYWITKGHNFMPRNPSLIGAGFPSFTNASGGQDTSYPTVGAMIPTLPIIPAHIINQYLTAEGADYA